MCLFMDSGKKLTVEEKLERARNRRGTAVQSVDQKAAERPRQMFLPGMDEFVRSLPNPVADSSLFAPLARGAKKMHTGSVLASRLNTTLTYWGVQLNELHADITMQLLWEQQRQGVITRKLAAWAAILATPTAVAGVYGMNFEHMPELRWTWGYPAVMGLIVTICLGLYVQFKRTRWL